MAEEFIIKLVSGDFQAGTGGGASGKSSGGVVGGIGKLGAIGGAVMGAISQVADVIMPAINALLRPLKGLLKGIARTIGELLRPLVDVVMIIIRPFFEMLKPIVLLFKTYMAPFMEIARGFSIISREQMASGDIAGAMGTSMEAIQTVLEPFIVSIASIALQLATTLIVSSITHLLSRVFEGIAIIMDAIPLIPDSASEYMRKMSEDIKTGGNSIIEIVNDLINNKTVSVLGEMEKEALEKLELLKKDMKTDLNTALVETPGSALTTLDTDMTNKMGDEGSVPTTFASGLTSMDTATSNFKTKMVEYGKDIEELRDKAIEDARDIRNTQIGLVNIQIVG